MSTSRVRFPQSEVTKLSARYRAGAPLEGLTGHDRRVLRRVLAEAGVRLRTRRSLPGGQLGWIVEQYQAGATLRELAARTVAAPAASALGCCGPESGCALGEAPSNRSECTARGTGDLLDGGCEYVIDHMKAPVLADRDEHARHITGREREGS
ncbi:MAG: hypothetical protein ACRDTE_25630 [Pseudonocardiaceae bacterium]